MEKFAPYLMVVSQAHINHTMSTPSVGFSQRA
jgi:hypothetical protein